MRWAAAVVVLCGGALIEVLVGGSAADFAVGCVLTVCGAVAWERRGESRIGPLLGLAGVAWFLGTAATPLLYLHRGPLAHATLAPPAGRLRNRLARLIVAAAWLDGAIEPLASNRVLTFVLAGAIASAALSANARTAGPSLAFAGVLALGAWNASHAVLLLYEAVVAAVGVALLARVLRGPESAVVGLVVDLGTAADAGTLQRKLAHTLGDASLEVGYRTADGLVDDAGQLLAFPATGSGRTVTPLIDHDEEIGVLVHDEGLLADPRLVASVAAAARVAVANATLQSRARRQAAEVEASRRRIVEAADAQRRQIREELDREAGRALDMVASLLADLHDEHPEVAQLERELVETQRELAQFAHGVRPAVLTRQGLMPALAQLAERSATPVRVTGTAGVLPEPVEAALFFVCSEALANIAKHAAASAAAIHVRADRDSVRVEVADDGRGGADASRGSGLAGLTDRVEALGGRLRTESPPGRGTRLVAWLPLSGGRA